VIYIILGEIILLNPLTSNYLLYIIEKDFTVSVHKYNTNKYINERRLERSRDFFIEPSQNSRPPKSRNETKLTNPAVKMKNYCGCTADRWQYAKQLRQYFLARAKCRDRSDQVGVLNNRIFVFLVWNGPSGVVTVFSD
jgi:hypothetical protein